MKKLLFVAFVIALFGCAFSLTVSASEWFGEVEYLENIKVENHIYSPVTEASPENGELSSAARVKLSCTCEKGEHTFPAYYVTFKEASNTSMCYFDFKDLNANLVCGGAEMNLNNLLAFEFPNGITRIEATLYYSCAEKNLEYLSFARAKTLTSMGNVQTGKNWFSGAPLQVVDIGPYVTNIAPWLFYSCGTLHTVNIPADSKITTVGNNAFYANKSLKSIYLPDTVSSIEGAAFKNCTSLEAFYIPASLTSFGASGSGNSPIDGCTSLYFVNDRNETEKPSIYYFPSSITKIVGEAFKNCKGLNDILVFHSGITSVADGWAFCNSNAISLVFLGNMTDVSSSGNAWNANCTLYFCNENDKSSADVNTKASAKKMFCFGEGNTDHLLEKALETEATCYAPKMVASYCFCGAIMGEPVTEGVALGHDLNGEAYYVFTTLIEKGMTCVDCARCDYTEKTVHEKAILTDMGYSVQTFGNGYSFENGYYVDKELLKKYESTYGVSVGFGFVFNAENGFEYDGTLDSFKLHAPIRNVGTDEADFSAFVYKLTYEGDAHLDDNLIIGAYIIEKNDEGETISFANAENGVFQAVSYNSVLESVSK